MKISLLSQLLQELDRKKFNSLVKTHHSDKHSKGIDSWTHLVSMLFCHLAKANSVREISTGLRSATGNLNHLGVSKAPSKSTISYINKHRDWHLFRDFYFEMLKQLEPSLHKRRIYARRLKRKLFILDSTTIPLCMKLFDWAHFRQRKGAIKLHTVLDYDTSLPVFMNMSDGKMHDVRMAKELLFPLGSVLLIDRAYLDFEWLYHLHNCGVFFVTRLKTNTQTKVLESYLTDEKQECILSDQDIALAGIKTSKSYPEKLRLVKVYDPKRKATLLVVTNNMSWTAKTISELYQARWDIEVFFKHIKQNLKIKTFVGTTPNAVMIQVWTAMIAILLLKYLQAKATYKWHLSSLVAFLRLNLFVKIDLWEWVNEPFKKKTLKLEQLALF